MENSPHEAPIAYLYDLTTDLVIFSPHSDKIMMLGRDYYQRHVADQEVNKESLKYSSFKLIDNIDGVIALMDHKELNQKKLFEQDFPLFAGRYNTLFEESNVNGIFLDMGLPDELAIRFENLLHVSDSKHKDLTLLHNYLFEQLNDFMAPNEEGPEYHLCEGAFDAFSESVLAHYDELAAPDAIKLMIAITILGRITCEYFLGSGEDSPKAIRVLDGLLVLETYNRYPQADIEDWAGNSQIWSKRLQGLNINIINNQNGQMNDVGFCTEIITGTMVDTLQIGRYMPVAWGFIDEVDVDSDVDSDDDSVASNDVEDNAVVENDDIENNAV